MVWGGAGGGGARSVPVSERSSPVSDDTLPLEEESPPFGSRSSSVGVSVFSMLRLGSRGSSFASDVSRSSSTDSWQSAVAASSKLSAPKSKNSVLEPGSGHGQKTLREMFARPPEPKHVKLSPEQRAQAQAFDLTDEQFWQQLEVLRKRDQQQEVQK